MSQHDAARHARRAGRTAAPRRRPRRPPAPRDERPRPQYGEYAPEGWTWKPPAGEHTSDPAPQMATPRAAAPARPRRPSTAAPTAASIARSRSCCSSSACSACGAPSARCSRCPTSCRSRSAQASEMLGTDVAGSTTCPAPRCPASCLAGSIAQIVLWVLTAWWSIARLRARKLAFWVPLSAGVVSFVLLLRPMFVVVLNDPTSSRDRVGRRGSDAAGLPGAARVARDCVAGRGFGTRSLMPRGSGRRARARRGCPRGPCAAPSAARTSGPPRPSSPRRRRGSRRRRGRRAPPARAPRAPRRRW